MSKEAYVPPTTGGTSPVGSSAPTGGLSSFGTVAPRAPVTISYLCADCGATNSIGQKEQIRCRECGHRVMYKKRTRRMVQFEAR